MNFREAGASAVALSLLTDIALALRARLSLDPQQRYRLVGVVLNNFRDPGETSTQPVLFG